MSLTTYHTISLIHLSMYICLKQYVFLCLQYFSVNLLICHISISLFSYRSGFLSASLSICLFFYNSFYLCINLNKKCLLSPFMTNSVYLLFVYLSISVSISNCLLVIIGEVKSGEKPGAGSPPIESCFHQNPGPRATHC